MQLRPREVRMLVRSRLELHTVVKVRIRLWCRLLHRITSQLRTTESLIGRTSEKVGQVAQLDLAGRLDLLVAQLDQAVPPELPDRLVGLAELVEAEVQEVVVVLVVQVDLERHLASTTCSTRAPLMQILVRENGRSTTRHLHPLRRCTLTSWITLALM
jgi:hypothetical protein